MRYSGMGYLDENGVFQVHRNILESLSIFDDAILFGIYYPFGKEKQKGKEIFHPDFMFTPIPYDLWPKTARLIIRVKRQAEAIRKITPILKTNHVTILNSVSNRSAHRYSTWDLHIAFEDVLMKEMNVIPPESEKDRDIEEYNKKNGFLKSTNEYKIISIELDKLSVEIKNIDKDVMNEEDKVLFSDANEEALKESIVKRVNSALHFFYYNSEKTKYNRNYEREIALKSFVDGNKNKPAPNHINGNIGTDISDKMYDFIYSPFSVRYVRGNFILQDEGNSDMNRIMSNSGGKISNILYLSYKNEGELRNTDNDYEYRDIIPTITFVEADSHFLGIRIIVIPKNKVQRFVKLNVYYQRQNDPYSSRGLLEYISSKLPSYYKIWKYHNRLFECRPTYGKGKLTFYLEDERDDANYAMNSYLEDLEWTINALNSTILEENKEHLKDFQLQGKAQSIRTILAKQFRINNSLKKENIKDVFISFSSIDRREAELIQDLLKKQGLSSYLSSKEIIGGDFFSENIRDALINTREFCLLYSPNSMNSSWVTTEWGAAWALQKRITPILLDITVDSIPSEHDRLKNFQYIKFRNSEIEDYAKMVYQRRFIPFESRLS